MTATLERLKKGLEFFEKYRSFSLVLSQLSIDSTLHDLPNTLDTRWIALHIVKRAALQPRGREPLFFQDQPLCYADDAPDYRT